MTKKEAKHEALAMWTWLMLHPTMNKEDYIDSTAPYCDYLCACALCECLRKGYGEAGCVDNKCPLSKGRVLGCVKGGPFVLWFDGQAEGKYVKTVFGALGVVIKVLFW